MTIQQAMTKEFCDRFVDTMSTGTQHQKRPRRPKANSVAGLPQATATGRQLQTQLLLRLDDQFKIDVLMLTNRV